jgi:hypothetical protein
MQGHTVCFKNMGLNSTTSFYVDWYSVVELYVCPCNVAYTENDSMVLEHCIFSAVISYCYGCLNHFLAMASPVFSL